MTDMPRFEGLWPRMAEWWRDRSDQAPLVIIRCGRGNPRCNNAIGEVKSDGQGHVLAMSKNEHPEPVVEWTPLAAPTVEELQAQIAERESHVLRHVLSADEHQIVYKRPNLPRAVAPIEQLSSYSCRDHGEVAVDREDLAGFVADTRTPKRTYWAHRDIN